MKVVALDVIPQGGRLGLSIVDPQVQAVDGIPVAMLEVGVVLGVMRPEPESGAVENGLFRFRLAWQTNHEPLGISVVNIGSRHHASGLRLVHQTGVRKARAVRHDRATGIGHLADDDGRIPVERIEGGPIGRSRGTLLRSGDQVREEKLPAIGRPVDLPTSSRGRELLR
ncbi:hypothetical protein D3C87_1232950 [compost metagenome]